MIRLLPVAALIAIAACATSSPEPAQSESAQAMQSGGDELVGKNEVSDVSKDDAAIEDIEAPDAPKTPTAEMPHVQATQPGVVCEKVIKTGSIMPTTVCRRQSDIKRREDSDQRKYEDIKRNTTLGADGI